MRTFYRLIILPLLFWQCWCTDPVHPGDNPDCPQHGRRPFITRFLFVCILAFALYLLAMFLKGYHL